MLTDHSYRIRLSPDEELRLWEQMQGGDAEARNALVESQVPWVMRLATRMRSATSELEDLISVGLLALVDKCLPRFDPRLGRLSTFCVRPVYWAMRTYENRNAPVARPANRNAKYGAQWDAAGSAAEHNEEVAAYDGLPDEELEKHEDMMQLAAAIERLPARSRFVVRARLKRISLHAIGVMLGVSRERVRQIESAAHDLLRADIAETSDSVSGSAN